MYPKRTGPEEWLVVTRRPLADDRTLEPRASRDASDQDVRYGYHYYLTPTDGSEVAFKVPALGELARVIKVGACIEASFKRGKGEVGMDEYQVRSWQGWHHHMALSLISVWFLIGETHRGQQLTPALTLPQVRYGLSLLLLEVFCIVFAKRLRSPKSSKPSPWNYVPPRASPGCGRGRGRRKKLMICWPRSTTGSPRGLTRRICRRRRHY